MIPFERVPSSLVRNPGEVIVDVGKIVFARLLGYDAPTLLLYVPTTTNAHFPSLYISMHPGATGSSMNIPNAHPSTNSNNSNASRSRVSVSANPKPPLVTRTFDEQVIELAKGAVKKGYKCFWNANDPSNARDSRRDCNVLLNCFDTLEKVCWVTLGGKLPVAAYRLTLRLVL